MMMTHSDGEADYLGTMNSELQLSRLKIRPGGGDCPTEWFSL